MDARRLRLLALDVFFLGTAMIAHLVSGALPGYPREAVEGYTGPLEG